MITYENYVIQRFYHSKRTRDLKAVIQRVTSAEVVVDEVVTGSINAGLLVLFGAQDGDTEQELTWLLNKILNLRIFSDEAGKMNHSVLDIGGALLVVSQFTLFGDCRKGRRPSFGQAAEPEIANHLYEKFCEQVETAGVKCERGIFAADMKVSLTNDGPVTLVLDTRTP
jgi:D-aminoacyl-tRNA deacylase